MKRKRLNVSFSLKASDDKTGAFEGYGSVFAVKDSYSDIVDKGAFVASLAKHKAAGSMPALLWQHNPGEPIGVWVEMKEDATGLYCKGQLVLETQRGAEAYALLKAGALSGLSIGFMPVVEAYNNVEKVTHLQEVDLWECSVVTFPANQAAQITEVKDDSDVAKITISKDTKRQLEARLRDVTDLSANDAKAFVSAGYKALGRRDDDEEKPNGDDVDDGSTLFAEALAALVEKQKR